MRDYSKVSPQFWIGATGKKLRTYGIEAQLVAMYLMTCSHANMIGMYYLPKIYIAHECGLDIEGASKGLLSAIEAGFCSYDEASEVVWVHEMATYQIGEQLTEKDLRVKGVQNEYNAQPESPYLKPFFDKYNDKFLMSSCRGIEAPSKPLVSQEHEQEHEQEQKAGTGTVDMPADSGEPTKNGTRLPADWVLPKVWGTWALENSNLSESQIRLEAEKFKDHWLANANQRNGKKSDWLAAWRNWVRSAKPGMQTKTQQVKANNERAVDEFVGGGSNVIEGEVVND
jgi:hypothetical protein